MKNGSSSLYNFQKIIYTWNQHGKSINSNNILK